MSQQNTIDDVLKNMKEFYASCFKHLEKSFAEALAQYLNSGEGRLLWTVKYNNIYVDETGKTYNMKQVYVCLNIFLTKLQNEEKSLIKDFTIELVSDSYVCHIATNLIQLVARLT